jgi:hypothetical protein
VLAFAKKFLSALGIIPKTGIFYVRVQTCETRCGFVPVKDTSAGARGIA